jgi:hypothetical protein
MAVTQVDKIVRVTWRYNLFPGSTAVEQCEHGVTYRAASLPSDATVTNAVLKDMADAALASQVANFAETYAHANVVADSCRVALEQTNGHTLFEQISTAAGALAWAGSASGKSLPFQNAMVISLYGYEPGSFSPIGKYLRGRFYLPPMSIDMLSTDNSSLLDDSKAGDTHDAWHQILKELQEHDYSGFPAFAPVLVINSRTTTSASPVTWTRFDTKIDTQRRRIKSLSGNQGKTAFP